MSIEFYDGIPGPNAGSRVVLDDVKVLAGPVPSLTVTDDLRLCSIYYYCDGDENDHFVIAANGTNATVVFDASATSDPNGAPLQFAWELLGEGQGLFASGVRITNALNGDTRARLHVSNGVTEAVLDFAVYLETPVDAINELKSALLEFDERSPGIRVLNALLIASAKRFQTGDPRNG